MGGIYHLKKKKEIRVRLLRYYCVCTLNYRKRLSYAGAADLALALSQLFWKQKERQVALDETP